MFNHRDDQLKSARTPEIRTNFCFRESIRGLSGIQEPPIPPNTHIQNMFSLTATNKPDYIMKPKYCNNCRKNGHSFYNCKTPITSFGLIAFRKSADSVITQDVGEEDTSRGFTPSNDKVQQYEYLMIRRRDTLGFIDFMRGKYSVFDKSYILNMIVQMTVSEKCRIISQTFEDIWRDLWGGETVHMSAQYKSEEHISRDKFNLLKAGIVINSTADFYTLEILVGLSNANTNNQWEFAEWGFPKGRRNYQEKDYDCALREFCEETGYPDSCIVPIQNILPYEEIFIGSNYKSYKHKYYLTYIPYEESIKPVSVQSSEVSCSEWKSYEDCMSCIRHYNVEKKRVLDNVHNTITKFLII